jgi:membrane protein
MSLTIRSVDVRRPVADVWAAWSDLERLPTVFRSLVDAKRVDDRHMAMAARIAGESRTWTAAITEMVEGDRIAWRSIDGPHHAGVVSFHALDERTTRVVVQLDWEPQGTFEVVGDRLGIVRRSLDADLRRFKEELEMAGSATTGDGRGRLAQPDRGREAESPTEIPKRGWVDVAKRTFKQMKEDNLSMLAAGVAFYTFLALVPGLVAVVSIYGLIREGNDVQNLVQSMTGLPSDVRDLLERQLTDITKTGDSGLGIALVVSVAAALWSASKGMKAMIEAVNIAFDESESRKFLKLRGVALLLTFGFIVFIVAAAFVIVVVPNLVEDTPFAVRFLVGVLRWVALFVGMLAALAVLYRVAPDRDDPKWRWVTPGAALATVLWLVGSGLFSLYADSFGTFNDTYGALGAVVVLLLWLNLTAYAVLFGAEVNAETEKQTAKDSTVGRQRPLGSRQATAADEVGPAMS